MLRYLVAYLIANLLTSVLVIVMLETKISLRMKRRYGKYWHHFIDDYHAKFITCMCARDPWMSRWFSGSRIVHWLKMLAYGWLAISWMLNCYYEFIDKEDAELMIMEGE